MKNLAVIGAGSWGTALSIVLSQRFETVRLWTREEAVAVRIGAARENAEYLPGFRLPSNITASSSLAETARDADLVLGVMPSQYARGIYLQLREHLHPNVPVLSATKGLEKSSLKRISQVIHETLPNADVAVLSGPTFAREVAQGAPTALVIASANQTLAGDLQAALVTPAFRPYTNSDVVGVEIGAALKNVVAIGAGVCQGLGLGHNAIAALITRGLAEITRLAVAAGGEERTLAGLAGLGDLVLTCTGELSRNRRVGMELARNRNLSEIVGSMKMVAEGIETTAAGLKLASRFQIDMPVSAHVDALLRGEKNPREAVRSLMERAAKGE